MCNLGWLKYRTASSYCLKLVSITHAPCRSDLRSEPKTLALLCGWGFNELDKKPLGKTWKNSVLWCAQPLCSAHTFGDLADEKIDSIYAWGTFLKAHPLRRTRWIVRCGRLRILCILFYRCFDLLCLFMSWLEWRKAKQEKWSSLNPARFDSESVPLIKHA